MLRREKELESWSVVNFLPNSVPIELYELRLLILSSLLWPRVSHIKKRLYLLLYLSLTQNSFIFIFYLSFPHHGHKQNDWHKHHRQIALDIKTMTLYHHQNVPRISTIKSYLLRLVAVGYLLPLSSTASSILVTLTFLPWLLSPLTHLYLCIEQLVLLDGIF